MWLKFFILQASFIFIMLGIGFVAADKLITVFKLKKVFWIDRLCIGAFAVIFMFAIAGVLIALVPFDLRSYFGKFFILTISVSSIYFFISKRFYLSLFNAKRVEKFFLIGLIVMSGVGLGISLIPVQLPSQLVDGPYVAKHDYLGVRIQYLTGNLPTDNSLPHVVSEYFLRDISFKDERPVMPGQEVSNRPILVSLILVPIRSAFSFPSKIINGLPKFDYIGSAWPDFSALMSDDFAYMFSLATGITLNALIFLAIGAFAVRTTLNSSLISFGVISIMLSSPFFIFQTIFTWPKMLAAFFILYSILLYCKLRAPILAGGFLAFAYLSHPYTVVFLIGFILHAIYSYLSDKPWVKISSSQKPSRGGASNTLVFMDFSRLVLKPALTKSTIKYFISFLTIFLILVAPWFVWTKLILQIPSNLVTQNLIQSGQGFIDFFWIRPVNFFNTILPVHLLHYPFELSRLVLGAAITLPGAIGILVFIFSLMYLFESKLERNQLFLIFIPSLLLIFIFSNQAVPALHGLQGPIALLILVGVIQMQKKLNVHWIYLLLGSQVLVNIVLLSQYFYKL